MLLKEKVQKIARTVGNFLHSHSELHRQKRFSVLLVSRNLLTFFCIHRKIKNGHEKIATKYTQAFL